MWNQIVAILAILIAVLYVIEQILLRVFHLRLPQRRTNWLRELVPLLVLVGILLILFSAVEAYRRAALEAWLLGLATGVGVTAIALAAGAFQQNLSPRGAFGFLRTYGVVMLIVLIGMYLAVRIIGPIAQVFVEGATSIIVLGAALAFSLRARVHETGAANKSQ